MSSFIIIIFLQTVVCLNRTYVIDFCVADCIIYYGWNYEFVCVVSGMSVSLLLGILVA